MNIKDRIIIDEFKQEKENFLKLEKVVRGIIDEIVDQSGFLVAGIEHRVKGEESLLGKLQKSDRWYQSLDDITDLLGARIICYFNDEVDKIGNSIVERFNIDWSNSSDKRSSIKADSFGYLSLHYICSLPSDAGYPEELCNKKFEIQIRTLLQHAWAAIEHDLGYKSEFGVPRSVKRAFARIAGLLEIADDEFARTREHIKDYAESIRQKIINDDAGDVLIDMISLREYMFCNKKMQAFLKQLAEIDGAEISIEDPKTYIEQLRWLNIDTIGKLQSLFDKNNDIAYKMAERTLKGKELDIISSNVALRFLCHAELCAGGYSKEQIAEFLVMSVSNKDHAERQAKRLIDMHAKLISEAAENE